MLNESPIPLYYQVANVLRHRILNGVHQPGERLGTEAGLCVQFGVSRITLRQALDRLGREGLIQRRRGIGTFVAAGVPQVASISFTGYLEDLFAQVQLTTTNEVQIDPVPANEDIARALHVAVGTRVVRIERVRWLAGEPLAHTVSYLPLTIGAEITPQDLREKSLMHVLERKLKARLEEAIQSIRAVLASPEMAEKLSIREGAPLLQVERTSRAAGRPVEFVLTHYRGDRYEYTVRLGRITRGER